MKTPNASPMDTHPALIVFVLLISLVASDAFAQGFTPMRQEKVELDPPAVVRIVKDADRNLEEDSFMAFSIHVEGLPEVANMWSLQVQFTSPTLQYERTLSREIHGEMLYAIGEPSNSKEEGWAVQNIAGISLPGWPDGELLKLLYRVNGSEGDIANIRLVNHPITPEGLAHESLEKRTIYEYNRVFDFSATTGMKIHPPDPDLPPYTPHVEQPRVIYTRD